MLLGKEMSDQANILLGKTVVTDRKNILRVLAKAVDARTNTLPAEAVSARTNMRGVTVKAVIGQTNTKRAEVAVSDQTNTLQAKAVGDQTNTPAMVATEMLVESITRTTAAGEEGGGAVGYEAVTTKAACDLPKIARP